MSSAPGGRRSGTLWLRTKSDRPVLVAHLRHLAGSFAAAGWRIRESAGEIDFDGDLVVIDDPWVEAGPALAEILLEARGEPRCWRVPRSNVGSGVLAWRPGPGPFTLWDYERRATPRSRPALARPLTDPATGPWGVAVARGEATRELLGLGWPPPVGRVAGVGEALLFRYPDPADHDRRELDRFLPAEGGVWLDIGCGSGRFGARHRRFDRRWIGIEPDLGSAREAARRLDLVLALPIEKALRALGRPSDGAVLADVLEHLADPAATLVAVGETLRPGGRVLASIPNAAFAPVLMALAAGRWDPTLAGVQARDHLAVFTPDSFARLATECGFRVERIDPLPAPMSRRHRLWAWAVATSVGGDPAALSSPQWAVSLVREPR